MSIKLRKWQLRFQAIGSFMRLVWLLMPAILAIVVMCKFGVAPAAIMIGLWILRLILRLVWKVLKFAFTVAIVAIIICLIIL